MADITLPPPFVSQMEGILGNTYTAFEQALLQPSKRSIRLHPHKWKTALDLTPVPWHNKGYWFSEEATVTYDPLVACRCLLCAGSQLHVYCAAPRSLCSR